MLLKVSYTERMKNYGNEIKLYDSFFWLDVEVDENVAFLEKSGRNFN